jgi:DNA polymerase III delta subunit
MSDALSLIVQQAKLDKRNLKRKAEELSLESKRLHAEAVAVKRELFTKHKRHERDYFQTLCSLVSENRLVLNP